MSPYRRGPTGSRARCEALAASNAALEKRVLPVVYARLDLAERDELSRTKARTRMRARSTADYAVLEELLAAYEALLSRHEEQAASGLDVVTPPPSDFPPPEPDLRHEPEYGADTAFLEERVRAFERALRFVDAGATFEQGTGAVRRASFRHEKVPYAIASALDTRNPRERREVGSDSTHVLRTAVQDTHPKLTLAPESEWTRLGKRVGLVAELETGDEAFDRAFLVRSTEVFWARARAVLVPTARAQLVSLSEKVLRLELGAGVADLAWSGFLDVSDLVAAATILHELRSVNVPRIA